MLANNQDNPAQIGTLSSGVQEPATFRRELLDFIADQLPRWRDRPDRPNETSETVLTSQFCAHLNSATRHSIGWDVLQFRVEEADEKNRGRKIDLVPSPRGVAIWVEGRRHTDFDVLLPLECKRLPTPKGNRRDEREYVISQTSSTGGIQRFKAGDHGAAHRLGAMIGYIQEQTTAHWSERVGSWISDLSGTHDGWSLKDLLHLERQDAPLRMAIFRSSHERGNGLADIELRHLWLEMN